MKPLDDLYHEAEETGIEVHDRPMRQVYSASFPDDTIVIDTKRIGSAAEETVYLAHEMGHCLTGSFYNAHSPFDLRSKHEEQADRWAIRKLIPREDLRTAVRAGLREIWELAEHFNVPEDFMIKAIRYYQVAG